MRTIRLLILVALVLAAAATVHPEGNAVTNPGSANQKVKPEAAAAAPEAAADDEDRVIIEHVDNLRYDPAIKTYHLRGNVVFANKDVKLYCDEADYNADADTAQARGHLRITDPNSVITGDLIDADFGKQLAIITGSVTIVTQKKPNRTSPKPPDQSQEKPGKGEAGAAGAANPTQPAEATSDKPKGDDGPEHVKDYWEKQTTITCERVEYYYADDVKKMIATPRVKAVQEDKTVWADRAIYEDIPRLVTLTGNVVLTTEKGDEMHCSKAVVAVDEDWLQAEGGNGILHREKKGGGAKPAPAGETPKPEATPAPAPKAQETP